MCCSLLKFPSCVGILPDRRLVCRFRVPKLVMLPNCGGMLPVKSFLSSHRRRSLVSSPSSDGIDPVNPLLCRYRPLKLFMSRSNQDGMLPVRLLFCSFSNFRLVRLLRFGIEPPISLPQRFSSSRLVKRLSHVGMPSPSPILLFAPENQILLRRLRRPRSGKSPDRLLLCSRSCSRFVRSPISAGILPESSLECRFSMVSLSSCPRSAGIVPSRPQRRMITPRYPQRRPAPVDAVPVLDRSTRRPVQPCVALQARFSTAASASQSDTRPVFDASETAPFVAQPNDAGNAVTVMETVILASILPSLATTSTV